jgi:hypothetical protein
VWAGLSACQGKQLPGPRNAFEFALTAICELDTRADDEVPDGPGDQDLSGSCQGSHACGDVDGQPSEVITADLALAGMQADSQLDPECSDGLNDRLRAANGPSRAVEGCEEAVPGCFDLSSANWAPLM